MAEQWGGHAGASYLENWSFRMHSLDCQVLMKLFMYTTVITFHMQVFIIFFSMKWKREQIKLFMKWKTICFPFLKCYTICRILMWQINNHKRSKIHQDLVWNSNKPKCSFAGKLKKKTRTTKMYMHIYI